jgi:GGDEF domain-containing protein
MSAFPNPDPLSGLPHGLRAIAPDFECGAVVWTNIDRLMSVNHAHGHMVGDLVIAAVADAIERSTPLPTYRRGGDEFLVTIPAVEADHAGSIADRIQQAVAAADHLSAHVADGVRAFGNQEFLDHHGQVVRLWPEGRFDRVLAEQHDVIDAAIRTITISVGVATAAKTEDGSIARSRTQPGRRC